MRDDITRILDANANRAREALRVIEEFARFSLHDAEACARIKRYRHELRRIADLIGPERLLAARDVSGDVGLTLKSPQEFVRGSAEDVVRAAFARFAEALRVISEYGKLVSDEVARLAEALRYGVYEVEPLIVLRGALRARLRAAPLYVIVTEAGCTRPWLQAAEAALRGGARALQLREKGLSDAELLRRAQQLRALTGGHEALLIVNDRADIAALAHADGVHVGQDDLSVRECRQIAGGNVLVGKSTHTLAQLEAAMAEDPDYIAVGPMFASTTKPGEHLAGPQMLAQAAPRTQIPLVGIGGISVENVERIMEAGASCPCVCSAVIGAQDVEGTARSIAERVLRWKNRGVVSERPPTEPASPGGGP